MKLHRLWLLVIALIVALLAPLPAHAVSLNSSGAVAHGLAGTTTSVDNRAVAAGGGGESARWFDDTHVIYQRNADLALALYDTVSGGTAVVDTRGANAMRANGGVWAAWLAGTGVFSSTGLRLPDAGLLDVGPDGAIAYTPIYQSGRGAIVRDVAGHEVTLDAGDWVVGLELLGGGRAIWTNGVTIRTAGIPPVTMVAPAIWHPRAADVGGEWWVAYWTETRGLVLHPFASPFGYVLRTTPDAFSHDLRAVNGRLRVAFATNLGESAGSVIAFDVDLSAPRSDLRVTTPAPPSSPDPIVVPPPQARIAPDRMSVVADVIRAHPEIDTCDDAQRGRIVDYAAQRLNAGGAVVWGRKSRNSAGTDLNTDGLTFKRPDGRFEIYDAIAGGGACGATWDGYGPFAPGENGFWVPPQLGPEPGASPAPSPQPPTPSPAPAGGITRAELQAAVAAAAQALREEFEAEFGHLEERLERLEQRPVDLNALGAAIDTALAGYEVNGKTRTDRLGLQHVVQLGITKRKQ